MLIAQFILTIAIAIAQTAINGSYNLFNPSYCIINEIALGFSIYIVLGTDVYSILLRILYCTNQSRTKFN